MTTTAATLFAIFTTDGLDQICETKADAQREAKDLRDMGCGKVKIVAVANEAEADAIAAKRR